MQSTSETGGQAFPCNASDAWGGPTDGMTLRQYAAIKLRVPDSGTDWLDDMIRQARRMDYAGQALVGMLANPARLDGIQNTVEGADCLADAMIAERGK
jgi:hypothetical protein